MGLYFSPDDLVLLKLLSHGDSELTDDSFARFAVAVIVRVSKRSSLSAIVSITVS
jgi:hypothetical protein